jgi:hypothetical protein
MDRYASARNWEDLFTALLESGTLKDHDHLVHLREWRPAYPRTMKNVRTVVFRTVNEIEDALLLRGNSTASSPSTLRETERSFPPDAESHHIPAATPTGIAAEVKTFEAGTGAMPSLQVADAETRDHEDGANHDEDPAVGLTQTMELSLRPEEENAARRIQLWYRRSLRRRKSSVDAMLFKNHAACVADAPNVLDPPCTNHRHYVAVVRGPVPHALCVLDQLLTNAAERKKRLLRNLLKVRHQDLEQAHERADNVM